MSAKAYKIRAEAIDDLEKIWEFTFHKWSKEQADRYYSLIISEIEFLSENPYSGKPIDYVRQGYRSALVKSHLIFYKIAENKVLEVVRVLHQSMDIKGWIK